MPGILPTRLTTILSLLLPVRTFTALPMVMLSMLTPFTSTSLSPTVNPACAAHTHTHTHTGVRGVSHGASLETPPSVIQAGGDMRPADRTEELQSRMCGKTVEAEIDVIASAGP
uniref:Uncharacterized protein n=1 Tax=Salarias fasciatus TaxID=181472 RepID=A0A672FAD1_SALFA